MRIFRRKGTAHAQQHLWLRPEEIVTGPHHSFYTKLAALLERVRFTETVHRICAPYYRTESREGGRALVEAFEAQRAGVLRSLREHGLLRGRKLGIDASVIEANASLSGLERRNSGESYWEYVRGLAADAGVDTSDPAAVARFDRARPDRRTSNLEWHNPDYPDARVGRTKSGACDMIYKPAHIVDLECGAVISAEIRHGDEGDTAGLADRMAEAAGKVEAIHGEDHGAGSSRVLELAADKGYHDAAELAVIRHETGMRTVIPDPSRGRRRMGKFAKEVRVALRAAERAVASPSGRALLRARGTHLERGFAHVLECGGLRRTYLRGRGNIARRYRCGIIAFNFTLLMRKLFGTGTPRQMAAAGRAFFAIMRRFLAMALRPPAPDRRAGNDFPWLSSGALTTRLIPAIWLEGSISIGAYD
jgi:hypothetical protein